MKDEVYLAAEEKMNKTITALQSEFGSIRAGQATPAVLDRVTVDYYGVPTQINQIATSSVVEARLLQIQPYDLTLLKAIEKAILASDIGITPQNDGRVIRLAFPQLTEERRRELVKVVSKTAEESKIAIRAIRREALDKYKKQKKASEITEDDLKNAETTIQKLTDKFCKTVDDMSENKTIEIMKI